jgi:ribonuclease HI
MSDLPLETDLFPKPAASVITIHTDGCCLGNPGPGGYGVVLRQGERVKELSGGFRRTTNNRMEILAAIVGLEALKGPQTVHLFSDSQYVVKAMEEGWVRKWKRQHWMRNSKEAAVNPDLWERLLKACEGHRVTFKWVRGHSGDPGNERCDVLAKEAAKQPNLPPDTGYAAPQPSL